MAKPRAKTKSQHTAAEFLRRILALILLCLWVFLVTYGVQFLLGFVFRWLHSFLPLSSAAAQTIYSTVSYVLSFVIIIFAPLIFRKFRPSIISRSGLGLDELPTWMDILLAPIGFIVYTILAAIVTNFFSLFPWFNLTEHQNVGYDGIYMGSDRFLAFFSVVIIAPIFEELIFRGFLYYKLKSVLQKTKAAHHQKSAELFAIVIASLLTSLVFAAMHGQWNVGVNVFTMSLVLCAMREVTGTIYSGMIMHMLKNALAFYLVYILGAGF